jgi:hypothetical protein
MNTITTLADFRATLTELAPPDVSLPLQSLWHEAKGDWTRAHDLLQNDNTPEGSWVHAYLHRKEPDVSNAAYWYRRAGQPVASGDFQTEWSAIVAALLNDKSSDGSS